MNTIEVMKQALEALKNIAIHSVCCDARHEADKVLLSFADAIAELENAEPKEPVAYVCGTYAGRFIVGPVNGATVLPDGMALYAAPPAPAIPAGWQLVPEEPTAQMLEAGVNEGTLGGDCGNYLEYADPIRTYAAMIAAAPQPPKE